MSPYAQLAAGISLACLWYIQWRDGIRLRRLEKDLQIAEHDIETIAATRKSYSREIED